MSLYLKIKYFCLFTLVDTEGRKIKMPLKNERSCFKPNNFGTQMSFKRVPHFSEFIS